MQNTSALMTTQFARLRERLDVAEKSSKGGLPVVNRRPIVSADSLYGVNPAQRETKRADSNYGVMSVL